jgi:HPt (histidine-containing phosphotransfer) domain-containing protein
MDTLGSTNILVSLKAPSIGEKLQQALNDVSFSEFDRALLGNASVVITDTGIENGSDVPGHIPVVAIVHEDHARLQTYFSHELSPDEQPETFKDEFLRFQEIADLSKNFALNSFKVLNFQQLEDLAQIGGMTIVKAGIEQFVRNTNLQLNECRALIEQEDYEHLRYTLHAIRNNSANIGAEQLAAFSAAMEDALLSENYPNFEAMLDLAYTLLSSYDYVSRSWNEHSITA